MTGVGRQCDTLSGGGDPRWGPAGPLLVACGGVCKGGPIERVPLAVLLVPFVTLQKEHTPPICTSPLSAASGGQATYRCSTDRDQDSFGDNIRLLLPSMPNVVLLQMYDLISIADRIISIFRKGFSVIFCEILFFRSS